MDSNSHMIVSDPDRLESQFDLFILQRKNNLQFVYVESIANWFIRVPFWLPTQ